MTPIPLDSPGICINCQKPRQEHTLTAAWCIDGGRRSRFESTEEPAPSIESVKAQCLDRIAANQCASLSCKPEYKLAKALLIAIEALEQYPDTNRKITALSKIAAAFR